MENKQFPEQEEQEPLPLEMPTLSVSEDSVEELPLIEDLSFAEQPPILREAPIAPAAAVEEPLPLPEPEYEPVEIPISEEPASEEPAAEEPDVIPVPAPEIPDFMERIPDTDLDYPEESQPASFSEIEELPEIQPDDQAMDSHGMLEPGEEEPDFDLSILNIPEPVLPSPEEEIHDQEYRDNGQEFDTMFHAPAQKEDQPVLPRQVNKGRPKRKKGEGLLGIPNILVTVVWLALIVMIGVTAGRMLWVCAADVLAFGREDKAVTVTIYEADTMDDIIDKLHENGLIRYKSLFKFYADISDAREDIKPGIYDLNTRYDYHALVNFMSPRSSREVITLTIPEGYTCRQIFSLLEDNRICTAVDAAAYAADGELSDYWFLEGVERGTETCLEGYLFPDTYEFYKNSTPREALEKMLDNFNYRFDDTMRAQIDTLNANLTGGGYTVREITIIASLIEKESAAAEESPKVAGVIYNRLFKWGSNPAYLNIDASIVYALDGKSELTREDLQTDHPYNTYTRVGLTPGPISNPGLASLKAALNPETHNYYFYVLNPATGMHQFSTTNEEHNAYVRQFAEAQ